MIIYHLVPKRYLDRQDSHADYAPKPFAQDGFIHCTKDAAEMANVATNSVVTKAVRNDSEKMIFD